MQLNVDGMNGGLLVTLGVEFVESGQWISGLHPMVLSAPDSQQYELIKTHKCNLELNSL